MIKILDLYCGAGGLGKGFEMTDAFKIVGGIDIFQPALNSFYKNHNTHPQIEKKYSAPTNLSLQEVKSSVIEDFKSVDIVVGGPPCQGFSVAGKRLESYLSDERNLQVRNFFDIIDGIRPQMFVMENVSGIVTTGQTQRSELLDQLSEKYWEIGYKTAWRVLHAEDFFVPQKRRRMFYVGWRESNSEFIFPVPQCSNDDELFARCTFTTVAEAIADLPCPNDGSFVEYNARATNWYQELMRENSDGIQAHFETRHSDEMIQKIKNVGIGQRLYPKFNHSWRKFDPNLPAPTIKENHRAPGLHYSRPSSISTRECARLQSMPDSFNLLGTKSQSLVQVGNAVPPLLSAAVATSCADTLRVNKLNRYGVEKYIKDLTQH